MVAAQEPNNTMSLSILEGNGAPDPSAPMGRRGSSQWKKPIVACLLSFLFPGLGQLLNRQAWRGTLTGASLPLLTMLAGFTRLFLWFGPMVAFFAGVIAWRILICADAFRGARRRVESGEVLRQRWPTFVVAGVLIILFSLIPSTKYFLHKFGYFRAFAIPSASMCPTICVGDRIVADMDAFRKTPPRRGDIILLDFHSEHKPLFIKRVVGVAGDVVSETNGAILVNGAPPLMESSPPGDCAKAGGEIPAGGELPSFCPVRVGPGSYFVVGDNSANSYDSRLEGFGLVTDDQVRGRPMHVYWSTNRARIGCTIK
jgi:signal peptidase I